MIDINIEDYKTSEKKIIINQKSLNQKNYSYNKILLKFTRYRII